MTNEDHQQSADDQQPITRREARERERERLARELKAQNTGPLDVSEAAASAPAGSQTEPAGAPQPSSTPPSRAEAADHDPVAEIFSSTIDERSSKGRGRGRRRRGRGWIAMLVALLVLVGGAFWGWQLVGDRILGMFGIHNDDFEGTGNGTEVDFSILEGDTGTTIATRLQEKGVIKESTAFIREVTSQSEEPQFYPGTYGLEEEMSAASALEVLTDDTARIENTVTIPEGTVASDIYTLVESNVGISVDDLQAAAKDPKSFGLPDEAESLEGFLFPATYTFEPGVDATTVLQTMVDRTYQSLDAAGVPDDQVWDIIRMASLVEKEARITEDFYKVARVFYNRLDIDMPLQSDATVTYGTGEYDRAATTDDERNNEDNPYNTYVHTGMIPGPISNPGDTAIDAAMNPADGPWLYFVTVNLETGETVFSETYEQHQQAVNQWLAWMEEHPDYG
ncbi:endolytic transglycosylase MltG [Gulosibacter sediminis]|uniref:endolytic transglycosylase MltG n=1 Tax=Gulosibacter sediminis TaxID=1729695 RepID=UPI0024A8B8A3|nr:endolytic transglycosylase MltG [Gulosibacter sediminis]